MRTINRLTHYGKYAFWILLPQLSFAAGGLQNEAKTMLETVRSAIVIVVGIVATIALLWQFAQGFMGRKTWGDILESCLWILGAGAAVALAGWIFIRGQSISF